MKKTREAKKVLALATSQLKKKEYLSLLKPHFKYLNAHNIHL